MAKDIWTGEEKFLKRKGPKLLPLFLTALALLFIVLIAFFIIEELDKPQVKEQTKPVDTPKEEVEEGEDLSQYEGLSQRELIDKLYIEAGLKKAQPIKNIEMTASQFVFEPSVIRVDQEDLVRLHIKSIDENHTIRIPSYFVSRLLPQGEITTIEFKAKRVGEFVFQSATHDQMKGRIIIKEKE